MSDLATPSAATIGTINAGADSTKAKGAQFVKPDRPDEDQFKKDLEKAEKDHTQAQEKLVSKINAVSATRWTTYSLACLAINDSNTLVPSERDPSQA